MEKQNHEVVNSWADMVQFGINALTGESDAYRMRLLCDVSEKGRLLMCDWLGLPMGTKFADNWNSMVGEDKAIGSVMLDRNLLIPLAEFACFRDGAVATLNSGGGVMGIWTTELLVKYQQHMLEYPNTTQSWKLRRNLKSPGAVGSRNVHQATGRVD